MNLDNLPEAYQYTSKINKFPILVNKLLSSKLEYDNNITLIIHENLSIPY